MNKKLLDAAVKRGFLRRMNNGFGLTSTGMKLKENILRDWLANAKAHRVCFNWQTGGLDHQTALVQAIRHHVDTLCHRPPFCVTLNMDEDGDKTGNIEESIVNDVTFTSLTKREFYYICPANRSRLCFDQLLRRRRSWWSELLRPTSVCEYQSSSTNSDTKAVRILPYSSTLAGNGNEECSSGEYQKLPDAEVIEEVPEVSTSTTKIAAVRNVLYVEPVMFMLLEDGKNEDEFCLHTRITPFPIVLIRMDDSDLVDALCEKIRGILGQSGYSYLYEFADGEESLQDQWKRLKASGVLYAIIIDGNVLRDGILRFLHHDMELQVETALPQLRQELYHRLGRPNRQ